MRRVFNPLPIVSRVERIAELTGDKQAYRRDRVTLGWEERVKARGRRRTDSGFEFATSLPLGTILKEGDCFVFDSPPLVIVVSERSEQVFVIRPQSSGEWALFAYHLGNSHQPAMFADDGIVCPETPWTEQVLAYHRIPYSRENRSFTPSGRPIDHRH